jgi:hypothetical protein
MGDEAVSAFIRIVRGTGTAPDLAAVMNVLHRQFGLACVTGAAQGVASAESERVRAALSTW